MGINVRIGDLLIEKGLITKEQLESGLNYQKEKPGIRLGEALVSLGFIEEKALLKTLGQRLNVPYMENPVFSVDLEAVSLLTEDVIRKYTILPLFVKDGTITIAISDPLDFYCVEDIRIITGLNVETVLSSKKDIQYGINKIFARMQTDKVVSTIKDESLANEIVDITDNEMMNRIDSAPIVKLMNTIVQEAVQANASDIHIEPAENNLLIRFRIDGDLKEHLRLQANITPLIVTRVKILSGMNIAEKRIPQDGRFEYESGLTKIDMRVSSLPTIHGEKIVMRLLGSNQDVNYEFEDMGFSKTAIERIRGLMKNQNGIILATGPTGSGKTTTLYTMLREVVNPKVNVVTVEDPVEKQLEYVNQVQVNSKAGLTFASGLRSILRQDPDIIMIGEIRDKETAQIAIRAAITGHLVISTLHTNDSFSTVARLIDMDVEPFLLASSIRGVIAQRLVKKICPHCKEASIVTEEDRKLLNDYEIIRKYHGRGCKYCNGTGYKGRTAVDEILVFDRTMQEIISHQGGDAEKIKQQALANGMKLMKEEVVDLVKTGVTTVEEAVKLLYSLE